MLAPDGRGVGEPLNETETVTPYARATPHLLLLVNKTQSFNIFSDSKRAIFFADDVVDRLHVSTRFFFTACMFVRIRRQDPCLVP